MIKLKSLLFEDITETPNFKKWFGNSKVVDKNGKPLVVYHGTKSNFNTFLRDKIGKNFNLMLGPGFYFTEINNNANFYTQHSHGNRGENIMPVYLSLKNPLIVSSVIEFKKIVNSEKYNFQKNSTDILIEMGYDGIILIHNNIMNEIVAFYPNQIKSAIGNNGEFSTTNPDITKESI